VRQLGLVLRSIWNSRTVRAKLLAVFALTVLFRFLAHVPLSGVDVVKLQAIFAQSQLLGILDIFSGGTLANFSLLAVGISPYITASILVQISGLFFPRIKEMQKESEGTRAQLTQWMRILSVPIGVMQSLSLLFLLRSQELLTATEPLQLMMMIFSLVTGSLIVMWIGEQLTRYGIGNGVSWIIFIGIISQVPTSIAQTYAMRGTVGTTTMLALGLGLAFVMASVVFMAESVRRLPLQQAKRVKGNREYGGAITYLPIKVNQFGVMPVIFALPLLTLPTTIATLLLNVKGAPTAVLMFAQQLQLWFRPGSTIYNSLYFIFVFAFTFFSIFVYFNPKDFAEDLKKSGTYVPGVRPGKPTADLLLTVLLRLSFIGGLYLGIVALLPILAQSLTGIATIAVGGTGLLIVVSVVLESVAAIQSQLIQDQYDQYLDKEGT
jgi:preprotein translocase subunit SecY